MIYTEPRRTQCGYRYSNSDLKIIWVTSAVQTDERALAVGHRLNDVYLIEKRDAGQDNWRVIFRGDEQSGPLHVLPGSPQGSLPVTIPPAVPVAVPPVTVPQSVTQAEPPPPPPPINFPHPS